MKTPILSVKGTRDFYPEEMAIRTWLYKTAGKVAGSFGYQEYEGPYLESIELYAAKSGDELVNQQSYVFPDRDGNLITLRPELTPTLARHGGETAAPACLPAALVVLRSVLEIRASAKRALEGILPVECRPARCKLARGRC